MPTLCPPDPCSGAEHCSTTSDRRAAPKRIRENSQQREKEVPINSVLEIPETKEKNIFDEAIAEEHAAPIALRSWLDQTMIAFAQLASLRENWDNYGAPRIHAGSVANAIRFLRATALPDMISPAVVPTGMGSVQLEWRLGRIELDVEISPEGRYDATYDGPGGARDWSGEIPSEIEPALMSVIGKLSWRKELTA